MSAQQQNDTTLDITDVIGKRIVKTRLARTVTIRDENAIAALEVLSRFVANPKWLIHLPPTNIGSPAIVIVCKDEAAATRRFGVEEEGIGIVYTRTGRHFFDGEAFEQEVLGRIRKQVSVAGLWEELQSDWFCFDCELMPWSAKAQGLIAEQYAFVETAGNTMLHDARVALEAAAKRGVSVDAVLAETCERADLITAHIEAYIRYCWPVQSVEDIKQAPFICLPRKEDAFR